MYLLKKLAGLVIFLIVFYSAKAQKQEPDEHFHDHHSNEIAVASTSVYLLGEKEFALGLHVHYVYNIPNTKFGLGVGYERIFDDHNHNLLGIIGSYRPIEHLNLNLSPGLKYQKFSLSTVEFAIHVETSYEFEIKNFHLGPVAGIAFSPGDFHIGLGIHLGIGF